mgnify:FL=1
MRRIIVSSTHPVKSLHGNTQPEWDLMSEEEQLRAWLKSCPFDYLEVGKIKGIRTINFEIKEDANGDT